MKQKTSLSIFLAARLLIDTPEKWWRGFSYTCDIDQHCLQTAIGHAGGYGCSDFHAFDIIRSIIGTSDIATWNDDTERTHAEVLAVLDKAILRESQKAFKGKI